MTDYIATGKVVPEKIAAIVAGIAEGCVQAGCALVGGETAEHPGVMGADEYDISGAGTGVVNSDELLSADLVQPGDVLIAMGSSGVHSNGYSLVRRIIADAGVALSDLPTALGGQTVGDALLTPTRIYAQDCLALIREVGAHALSHITGGGLAGNLSRILPGHLDATVDRSTWSPNPIFQFLAAEGRVARADLEPAFNLGVGMVAVVAAERADDALALLRARGVPAWTLGSVHAGSGQVTLTGEYAASGF